MVRMMIALALGGLASCSASAGADDELAAANSSGGGAELPKAVAPSSSAAVRRSAPAEANAVEPGKTHCAPFERVVYSCQFTRRAMVSVCEGGGKLAYRFGPPGTPDLQLVSDGGNGAARFGWIRGQGSGFQKSLRFTSKDYSYTVYSAVYGELSETPGMRHSGLVVAKGDSDILSTRECPIRGPQQDAGNFSGDVVETLPDDPDAGWQ